MVLTVRKAVLATSEFGTQLTPMVMALMMVSGSPGCRRYRDEGDDHEGERPVPACPIA